MTHVTPPSVVVGFENVAPPLVETSEDQFGSAAARVTVVLMYVWSAIVGVHPWHSTAASKLIRRKVSMVSVFGGGSMGNGPYIFIGPVFMVYVAISFLVTRSVTSL